LGRSAAGGHEWSVERGWGDGFEWGGEAVTPAHLRRTRGGRGSGTGEENGGGEGQGGGAAVGVSAGWR
jgi:hypothetical protein